VTLLCAYVRPPWDPAVVTRNPHEADIRRFLQEKQVAVTDVRVVPKTSKLGSKAECMAAIVPGLDRECASICAVFVDDDVRECKRAAAALPGLFCVLFRRTGL